ncbi:cell cycle control protein [Peniophora sp. CONT]|nr:cell cycle control protein [Peniophora sp. CONT]
MGLFRRKQAISSDAGTPSEKPPTRFQKDIANLKQQRLKSKELILNPTSTIITLFIIGLIFAPIGGVLVWGSGLVTEITINYTDCDQLSAASDNTTAISQLTTVPDYNYRLRTSSRSTSVPAPQYALVNNPSGPVGFTSQCLVRFDVPYDLEGPVFMYYQLSGFLQNHRRYVQNQDNDQLLGKYRSADDLNGSQCDALYTANGKVIYPCGLIANSIFNDTFGLTLNSTSGGSPYTLTDKGIAWPKEKDKYRAQPGNPISDLTPPPNWALRYPQGYTNSTPPPNLAADEHFQVWMRPSGTSTFTKLWSRNDGDTLRAGTYDLIVSLNYPVRQWGGKKSIVLTTVSWIGGKNPFLGWAYVAASVLIVSLAIIGAIRTCIRPIRPMTSADISKMEHPM